MKRKLMLLLTCLFVGIGLVTAQITKVTGTVISEEDGLPVVGASILVKGTTVGTVTDMDGKFTLSNVPSSAKTLVVSFIGMATQEVAIKQTVNITLKSDAEVLEEVVVTGYGVQRKASFTGAAAIIGEFVGLFPVETAIGAGMINNSMGGTGNIAVLSASDRMEMIAFAQMANRLSGAIILILGGLLASMLN